MQISYNWLQKYVDIPWDAEELGRRLTLAGLEVERLEEKKAGFSGVVVGNIVELAPHPGADKLLICQVEAGKTSTLTILTGADNLFLGAKVPLALPGARLPGGEMIDYATFRGLVSQGMLCSADELGIDKRLVPPDVRDGIYLLPETAPIGEQLHQLLGQSDWILHLDLTPNRADCQSLLGVAYEVAALAGGEVHLPKLDETEHSAFHGEVTIDIQALDLCPGYLGLLVDNVRVAASPLWLQTALQSAGIRPINNVVDVTNYVLMELGQPLHAFDFERVQGGRILPRRARAGEIMATLDGVERNLCEDDLVIADTGGAVAIAGVMGGADTEVTNTTTRVLLESAYFDYKTVRRTSRRLGLHTDASSRFDKGVDPARVPMALARAAYLLRTIEAGEPQKIVVGVVPVGTEDRLIELRPERVTGLLGVDIPRREMQRLLEQLGLRVVVGEETWQVSVPSRRADLALEVDLIEEIARLFGYDKIPVGEMAGPLIQGALTEDQRIERSLRSNLLGLGVTEAITMSFIDPEAVERLAGPAHDWNTGLLLQNPLSKDRSLMRPSLLPGLLNVLSYNGARQQHHLSVYELATVFLPAEDVLVKQPEERLHLGLACMGELPGGWYSRPAPYDFYYLKGLLSSLLAALGVEGLEWRPSQEAFLHPGRSAAIYFAGSYLGYLGELHPDIATHYGLKERAVVSEISLAPIFAAAARVPLFTDIPKYPAVSRDVAVVVEQGISAAQIEDLIRTEAGALLVDIQLFDVFSSSQLGAGKRSLAYALVFQDRKRTLVESEISGIMERIVAALGAKLGATLR